jgi:hypothetical protein
MPGLESQHGFRLRLRRPVFRLRLRRPVFRCFGCGCAARCFGVSVAAAPPGVSVFRFLSALTEPPKHRPRSGTETPITAAHHRFRTLGERVIRPIFNLRPSTFDSKTFDSSRSPHATGDKWAARARAALPTFDSSRSPHATGDKWAARGRAALPTFDSLPRLPNAKRPGAFAPGRQKSICDFSECSQVA